MDKEGKFRRGGLSAAVGFAIGNKGYIGTGRSATTLNVSKDFWEYDPDADLWIQKADFGGRARHLAVGLCIGSRGYIGTGLASETVRDFWEYDPGTNLWIQKADYPGTGLQSPAGFSIGSRGYVGLSWFGTDFWEYDPSHNTWNKRADLTRERHSSDIAFSFSIGNRGYVGPAGLDGFWEYIPASENTITTNVTGTSFCPDSSLKVAFTATGMFNAGNIFSAQLSDSTGSFTSPVNIGSVTATGSDTINAVIPENTPAGTRYRIRVVTSDSTVTVSDNGNNLAVNNCNLNGAWTRKADFGGGVRAGAISFSIGSKGYVGTGSQGFQNKDFWEYDPFTNTWTQKADYGGSAGYGDVGFSIGSKGYVSAAGNRDFWEYDPSTNMWTQKADFGGTERFQGVAFSIGSKGYVGTGWRLPCCAEGPIDFWEYDPATDTWTQKADFAGVARGGAVGFSIGNKGYIGAGVIRGLGPDHGLTDFWEYDPVTNTWTQKADVGGVARGWAAGFSVSSKGYIGTGMEPYYEQYLNDFWEYTPATNTWIQRADFAGVARGAAVGFSIGSKGYMGTGYETINGEKYHSDFWEYTPAAENCPGLVIQCKADTVVTATERNCGAIINYTPPVVTNACDTPTVTQIAGLPSGAFFPVGVTTNTFVASGSSGKNDTCSFTVTVKDTKAPFITPVGASPSALWPPNHKMKKVSVNYYAWGNCRPASCSLDVTSDESVTGTGYGDKAPDWVIVNNHHVLLRAERAGHGNGRTYTISVTCTDTSGNISTQKTRVFVPHHSQHHYSKGEYTSGEENDGYLDANGDYFDDQLVCKVLPNPSSQYFNLEIESSSTEKIEMNLYDISGRFISKLYAMKNQTYTFGGDLRPGMYMVEVRQGQQRKTVKIVKQ